MSRVTLAGPGRGLVLASGTDAARAFPAGGAPVMLPEYRGDATGEVGLLVWPGQPGCQTCFRLRRAAISGRPEPAVPQGPGPDDLAPLARKLAPLLAAGKELPPVPGLVEPGPRGLRITHRLLPRPDCPDCGGGWEGGLPAASVDDLCDPVLGPLRRLRLVSDGAPPFHVHVASALTHNSFIRPAAPPDHAWGRGESAAAAARGAVFEAVENYANALWRQAQLLEPGTDWPRPRYFALFQPDGRILWRRAGAGALSMPGQCAGRKVAVPLEAAVSDAHPQLAGPALAPSRSGVGAGNSLAKAGASALAEVVERFTLARHWGAGLSGRRLAPEGFAPRYYGALAADGLEVDLVELPGFAGHRVVAARVRSETLPHEAVGAAARRSRPAAVRGALGEALQVRVGLLASLKNPDTAGRARALAAGRQEVETAFDRALLAAMGAGRAARDRFFAGTRARLAMPGLPEVAYTDLTTPDLRAAGCFVVRAVLFCDAPALNGPGAEFAEPFVLA